MQIVRPLQCFTEIQGCRPQSNYCAGDDDTVVELESFDCGVYCVRRWEAVTEPANAGFNAFLVTEWRPCVEQWFNQKQSGVRAFRASCRKPRNNHQDK